MKKYRWYIIGTVVFAALLLTGLLCRKYFLKRAKGNVYTVLQQTVKQPVNWTPSDSITGYGLLDIYYRDKRESTLWTGTGEEQKHNRAMLTDMLAYSSTLGLNAKDYHRAYIRAYDSLIQIQAFDAEEHKNETELIFTDAALTFLFHTVYGKDLDLSYSGIKYRMDSTKVINMFSQMMVNHNWRQTIDSLEPKSESYDLFKIALNRINTSIQRFPQIDSIDTLNGNTIRVTIIPKLKAFGLIDDDITGDSVAEEAFSSYLRKFQEMTGIEITGRLDKKTMAMLQIPFSMRVEEIKRSLNFWRWSRRLAEKEFVLVNIAATRLQVMDDSESIGMKVIAGEYDKQTPLFAGYITRVTTYPHWVVPRSIATKEMLPKIKKDTSLLRRENMEVMDIKGNILDASAIDWRKYSINIFPFIIRQTTGCDDALGVLKFDLNVPFDIYLHDTNAKGLFNRNYRLLSHGCIRLEKPFEFAKYLLEDRFDATLVNSLDNCMKNQEPQEIRVKKKIPAIIYYMTADINDDGKVQFFKDTYGLEKPGEKRAQSISAFLK